MSTSPFYPASWAFTVVEQFQEKYGRGCKNLANCWGIREDDLIRMACKALQTNQTKWERFKKIVKMLQYDSPKDYRQYSFDEKVLYIRYLKHAATEEILDERLATELDGC